MTLLLYAVLGPATFNIMRLHADYIYPHLHEVANFIYFCSYVVSFFHTKSAQFIGLFASFLALIREKNPLQTTLMGLETCIVGVANAFDQCRQLTGGCLTSLYGAARQAWTSFTGFFQAGGH
jgi:hypothetical protein